MTSDKVADAAWVVLGEMESEGYATAGMTQLRDALEARDSQQRPAGIAVSVLAGPAAPAMEGGKAGAHDLHALTSIARARGLSDAVIALTEAREKSACEIVERLYAAAMREYDRWSALEDAAAAQAKEAP